MSEAFSFLQAKEVVSMNELEIQKLIADLKHDFPLADFSYINSAVDLINRTFKGASFDTRRDLIIKKLKTRQEQGEIKAPDNGGMESNPTQEAVSQSSPGLPDLSPSQTTPEVAPKSEALPATKEKPQGQDQTEGKAPLFLPTHENGKKPSPLLEKPKPLAQEQHSTITGVLIEAVKRGWIKLWRKLMDSNYFKDSYMIHLIVYLLLKACHGDGTIVLNGKPLFLRRGELIFGYEATHRDTGIPIKILRRRMRTLETDNPPFLTRERPTSWPTIRPRSAHERAGSNKEENSDKRADQRLDNRAGNFSIISICNYEHYQGSLNDEGQATKQIKSQAQNKGEFNDTGHTKGQPQGSHRATYKKYKKLKKEKHYVEGSEPLRLARLLLEEIRKNKPDFKEPNLQAWATDFDRMLSRDNRSPDRIEKVIKWVQGDYGDGGRWKGWASNILSPGKLREKFDTLELKLESTNGRKPKSRWKS